MCQSLTASLLAHMETSLYQPGSSGCSHHVRWMKPGLVIRWWRTSLNTVRNLS